jgi:4-alpha-glucanotransferase
MHTHAPPVAAAARRAGLLLHVTALPGRWGIGDLGPVARDWITRLAAASWRVWQVLPLQPTTGFSPPAARPDPSAGPVEPGCPYLSPSAFALEPCLLSIDDLVAAGWLAAGEVPAWAGPGGRVDFAQVRAHRAPLFARAAQRAVAASADWRARTPWVETWGVFRALQRQYGGDWRQWPEAARHRDPAALAAVDPDVVAEEIALQWLVEQQWGLLAAHARAEGVALWGDLPIFVDAEACDVWGAPELWRLGDRVVSGVPPDAFSPGGQRWGHPLYAVDAHVRTQHAWWRARAAVALARTSTVRIDHFRGLAAWWEVPADAPDARGGRWVPGLGAPLLDAFQQDWGRPLPFIAEDLGVITPDVEALRDDFGLPGMAVLQFAWDGDPTNPHHPDQHRVNQVVYTGTHDSDTTAGWARSLGRRERIAVAARVGCRTDRLREGLIDAALGSRAQVAILPVQDLLGLGSEARFNVPGTTHGNWSWRLERLPTAAQLGRLAPAIRAASRV